MSAPACSTSYVARPCVPVSSSQLRKALGRQDWALPRGGVNPSALMEELFGDRKEIAMLMVSSDKLKNIVLVSALLGSSRQ
jgi:hypothetical protein